MLLRTLKLKDFRQFKGEQSVSFSVDPVRNVTVIMGENGSGKTTLAQAFTWCLYGDTDFDDKSMLCKATAQSMLPNTEETVRVELALTHNGIEYLCIREQRYSKDSNGNLRRPNQPIFKIAYKGKDGQREYISDTETEIRMKEILPKELSKYFFFDGERIGNMSKEIKKGKSQEFAQAVRGLLGLSAFQAALDHINGRPPKVSVIRSYNESYDSRSDSKEKQERLVSLRQRIDKLTSMDSESAQNGDFDELFESLYTEMYAIKDELEDAKKTNAKLDTAVNRIDEMTTVMYGLKNHPVEYDEQIVRQLISSIKVVSAEQILILFKDGTEMTADL